MLATCQVHACYLCTCWLVHACYLRIPARLIDPSDDRASFVSKTLQRLRSHVLDGSSDSSRFRSPMASPKPTSLRSSQADSSLIIGYFPHGSSSTVRKEPSSPTKPTEQRTESHASATMSLERRSGVASLYAEERLNKGGRDSTGIPGTGDLSKDKCTSHRQRGEQ